MRYRVGKLLAGRLAGAVGTLALTILVSRVYGADGRGRMAIAMLIAVIGGSILAVGLDAAATYSVAAKRASAGRWRTFAFRWGVLVGGASCAVLVALSGPIAAACGVHRLDVVAGAAAVPAVIAANILLGAVLGDQRSSAYGVLLAVQGVVPAAFVIAIGVMHASLGWVLAGWTAGVWVSTVAAFAMLTGSPPGPPLEVRREIAYGWRTVLGTLLQLTNYRLDALLVAGFSGPAATGIYVVAVNVAEVLGYLPSAVEAALFPAFASASSGRRAALRRALLLVLVSTAGAALVMALLAPWALPEVFGSAFSASVEPLRLLLPGMIAIALVKVMSAYLMGLDRPFETTVVAGASAVCTIALDLLLIPRHGPSGAAVASSVAYALSAVLAAVLVFARARGRSDDT